MSFTCICRNCANSIQCIRTLKKKPTVLSTIWPEDDNRYRQENWHNFKKVTSFNLIGHGKLPSDCWMTVHIHVVQTTFCLLEHSALLLPLIWGWPASSVEPHLSNTGKCCGKCFQAEAHIHPLFSTKYLNGVILGEYNVQEMNWPRLQLVVRQTRRPDRLKLLSLFSTFYFHIWVI